MVIASSDTCGRPSSRSPFKYKSTEAKQASTLATEVASAAPSDGFAKGAANRVNDAADLKHDIIWIHKLFNVLNTWVYFPTTEPAKYVNLATLEPKYIFGRLTETFSVPFGCFSIFRTVRRFQHAPPPACVPQHAVVNSCPSTCRFTSVTSRFWNKCLFQPMS